MVSKALIIRALCRICKFLEITNGTEGGPALDKRKHYVTLEEEKCRGCINCLKSCPTEAIRVRGGKAHILEERCIDCGECLRICPHHAKVGISDSVEKLKEFKYVVALPTGSLFGQFRLGVSVGRVISALLAIGFHEVHDLTRGYRAIEVATGELIKERRLRGGLDGPLVSSLCPVVVRLIQVRFPSLIENLNPLISPVETTARLLREERSILLGLNPAEIGVFYITPCPAQENAIKQSLGVTRSAVSGVISIANIYYDLLKNIPFSGPVDEPVVSYGVHLPVGEEGQNLGLGQSDQLVVCGLHNAINVLEELERGKLKGLSYLDCRACTEGCLGGPFTVENPHVARVNLARLRAELPRPAVISDDERLRALYHSGFLNWERSVDPRPVMVLDHNVANAIRKLKYSELILKDLPWLDCGSCGAPNCRTLAEDITCGRARENDCVFKLRDSVQSLAKEIVDLAEMVPLNDEGGNGGKKVDQIILRELIEKLQREVKIGKGKLDVRKARA